MQNFGVLSLGASFLRAPVLLSPLFRKQQQQKTKLPKTKLMSSFGLHQYSHLENVKKKHIINIGAIFFF